MKRLLRWRAIVPLVMLLALMAAAWWLYADRLVEKTVEDTGADLVGAKVDVASADLRLGEGTVSLTGLQVTNPNAPMQNLFEAEEVLADIRMTPLLTKKYVVEHVAIRGVRFGTARTTSGALDGPRSARSSTLARQLAEWSGALRVPPLNLEGLGAAVVNVQAISADSLRTLGVARALVRDADSSRQAWEQRLSQLNPAPTIDSARALVGRLQSANPGPLGVVGVTRLVGSSRRVLSAVTDMSRGLAQLDTTVRGGVRDYRQALGRLDEARSQDYAYARRLLRLPSLDTPDLSPPGFGQAAAARLEPILFWVNRVSDLLPPGLDPRRYVGRKRLRRSGVTVVFPKPGEYPRFLLELAEVDLEIGGASAAAGRYAGRLAGVTSAPALYGRPLEAHLERTGGVRGPRDVSVAALIDHTRRPIRDSLRAFISGTSLPTVTLPSVGARVELGTGTSELSLSRVADSLAGRWRWRSDNVTWSRLARTDSVVRTGLLRNVEDFVWRTVSSLTDVDLEIRISGSVRGPSLEVSSNVGRALARSLRAEVGREVERAERQIRAEVDRLVAIQTTAARAKVEALESEVAGRIGVDREQLTQLREELEREIRRLGGGVIP